MNKPLDIVIIGLTLSSSWGNGHATTYRALLKGLAEEGHRVLFLERDVEWYANNRDLPNPDFCELALYYEIPQMIASHGEQIRAADAVIIGSYVPEGAAVIDAVAALHPACFCFYDIDTPVTLAKLARGEDEFLAPRQIRDFDIYFSFTGGPLLRTIEKRYGVARALPLYCSVDGTLYGNTGEACKWDLGYLGTYSPDRQPTLERLLLDPARRLPEKRFVVAGPQYPDDIAWPANVERIDHLPPSQHASFYSRQRFTLNVTRADMIVAGWSPSVRLFEAAACAAPIISDAWEGLSDLFPANDAILIARDTQSVVSALTEISDEERRQMGEAARTIVLASHTGRSRAIELAEAIAGARHTGAARKTGLNRLSA